MTHLRLRELEKIWYDKKLEKIGLLEDCRTCNLRFFYLCNLKAVHTIAKRCPCKNCLVKITCRHKCDERHEFWDRNILEANKKIMTILDNNYIGE